MFLLCEKMTQSIISQMQTVARSASMHRNIWVENADRLVAGFLEMFEERFHQMVISLTPCPFLFA